MNLFENSRLFESTISRHWSPESEAYTGADSLLTAQDRGWRIVDYKVDCDHRCQTQHVKLFVFTLRFEQDTVEMRIISNPYVERLVQRLDKLISIKRYQQQIKMKLTDTAFTKSKGEELHVS